MRFCGIINSYIKPLLLTPEMLGLWTFLSVFVNYASYFHVGSKSGMFYNIPALTEDNDSIKEIESGVFWGSLSINFLFAVLFIVFAVVSELSSVEKAGLFTLSLLFVTNWIYDYFQFNRNAHKDFAVIIKINFIRAVIGVALNFILIYFFGIHGLYLSSVTIVLLSIILIKNKFPEFTSFKKIYLSFYKMIKSGAQVTIYNLMYIFFMTLDKLFVGIFLGKAALGYYALAGLVLNFVTQLPNHSRNVTEPYIISDFSKIDKVKQIKKYLIRPQFLTAYAMVMLLGPSFFAIEFIIKETLSNYTPGIQPIQILLLGSYFLSLTYSVRAVCVVNGWLLGATFRLIMAIFLDVLLIVYVIKGGYGIAGVAFASSVSFFTAFLLLSVFLKNKTEDLDFSWFYMFINILVPFLLMVGSIFMIEVVFGGYSSEIFMIIMKMAVFITIMTLVIYFQSRNSKYIETVSPASLLRLWK